MLWSREVHFSNTFLSFQGSFFFCNLPISSDIFRWWFQAPREVRERLDDTHKPQGLTIIKVDAVERKGMNQFLVMLGGFLVNVFVDGQKATIWGHV